MDNPSSSTAVLSASSAGDIHTCHILGDMAKLCSWHWNQLTAGKESAPAAFMNETKRETDLQRPCYLQVLLQIVLLLQLFLQHGFL